MHIEEGARVRHKIDERLSKLRSLGEIPEYLCCPISQDVINEPVLLVETGHLYEKDIIEDWLRCHDTCPLTGVIIKSKLIAPVHVFRTLATEYKTKYVDSSLAIIIKLLDRHKDFLSNKDLEQIKSHLDICTEYNHDRQDLYLLMMRLCEQLSDYAGINRLIVKYIDFLVRTHKSSEPSSIIKSISNSLLFLGERITDNIDLLSDALSAGPHHIDNLRYFKEALVVINKPIQASRVCRNLSPMYHFVDKKQEGIKLIIEAITLDPTNESLCETFIKSLKDKETLLEFCKLAITNSPEPQLKSQLCINFLQKILVHSQSRTNHIDVLEVSMQRIEEQIKDELLMRKSFEQNAKFLSFSCLVPGSDTNLQLFETDLQLSDQQIWCVLSLSDNIVATSHQKGGYISIWNLEAKTCRRIGHNYPGMDFVWEMTRVGTDLIACASRKESIINIFDWRTGENINTIQHDVSINSAGHSSLVSFGCYVMGALKDNTITIWDIRPPGGKIVKRFMGHQNYVNCICLLSDTRFASGSLDRSIKIWNINQDECEYTIESAHDCGVTSLCLLNNNVLVSAGGSEDRKVKTWDIKGRKCINIMSGHKSVVKQMVKLTERTIATASWDTTIKIWDVIKGECVRTLDTHEDQVLGLILNGNRLVSVSKDKTMRVWDSCRRRSSSS
ncbi:HET-E1 [Acrasis kona]|uniref:HET-E1 n=1 Tax=Acrasis kona TaxID=1008807 RepID=A0AAW2YK61_9EUKA